MKQHILKNPKEFTESILCLDETGNKIGDIDVSEVLAKAEGLGLDAVVMSKNPNVVKIMDFGKFKYQQEKREKENKKKHRKIEDKEIQFSLNIADHDFNIKMKKAVNFLNKKNRVTFKLRLKGRENSYTSEAIKVMEKAASRLSEEGIKTTSKINVDGNTVQMVAA